MCPREPTMVKKTEEWMDEWYLVFFCSLINNSCCLSQQNLL